MFSRHDLGLFMRGYIMKIKIFLDKGREYYNIVYSLIYLSILVGVWLPYLQEALAEAGFEVSKTMISVVGLGSLFVLINLFLILVGWFSYRKNLTQSEYFYSTLQNPWSICTYKAFMRLIKTQKLILETIGSNLSKPEFEELMKKMEKLSKESPVDIRIGNKIILDLERDVYEDLQKILEKSNNVRDFRIYD